MRSEKIQTKIATEGDFHIALTNIRYGKLEEQLDLGDKGNMRKGDDERYTSNNDTRTR